MFLHKFREDFVLTLELLFQKRNPPVLVVAGTAGAGLECGSGVLEEFLLPAVEHRGMDPVLVTQVRNGGVFEEMEPKDGDLLLSREAIPDFLGHGGTSARNCSLFEQAVCPISTEAKQEKDQDCEDMAKRKATSKGSVEVGPVLELIVAMTDQFCRERLNEEYAVLCRRLAEKLARKRPSPLLRGKPESWASGIVRVIGWVNFLGDPSQPHHMRMTDIDEGMGVSEATGSAKAKAIRDLLKPHPLDPEWTLPSRMEQNPMAWMIQVNGLIADARHLPRDIQEEAFRKGLIPYIPADQTNESVDE